MPGAGFMDAEAANSPPLPRDHNSAGAPLAELLAEETAALAIRRDELLGSVSRVPVAILDEITNQRCADLVRLIAACRKTAETNRVSRKEPFLQGERLVDVHYKRITDPLDQGKRTVEQRMTLFQRQKAEDERRVREEEARRAAEEATRLAAEAAAREAAAQTVEDIDEAISTEALAKQAEADAYQARRAAEVKAAELSRTRGDYGATASLRTVWKAEITDRSKLDFAVLGPHLNLEDLQKAANRFVAAGGRKCGGLEIREHQTTVVRG